MAQEVQVITNVAWHVFAQGFRMMSRNLLRQYVGHVARAAIGLSGWSVDGEALT